MTFITHGFRVSVVSDLRERERDLGSPLRFMLRSSLVECVSVLHGTCLQCVEKKFIHQYVQPCLSKNPKYTCSLCTNGPGKKCLDSCISNSGTEPDCKKVRILFIYLFFA